MTILFDLSLDQTKRVVGFARGPVRAVEAALIGSWFNGKPYSPDLQAVRECLPHYYRKAFDRAGSFWFMASTDDKQAYRVLRDRRGVYMNTIYATARDFTP